MLLTTETANRIGAGYDREVNGYNEFWDELRLMFREHGLQILTEEAQRDLILALGKGRRMRECRNIKSRAEYAAARAAIPLAAE